MAARTIKQFVIAVMVFGSLGVAALIIWFVFFPPVAPTCFDTIQNQGEAGVDCGGPCAVCKGLPEAPEVLSTALLESEGGSYDIVVEIKNPNALYGAKRLPYVLRVFDAQDALIGELKRETFLLPLETHVVIEPAFRPVTRIPQRVEFVVSPEEAIEWIESEGERDAELIVRGQEFRSFERGPEYHDVRGVIVNRSPFDYDKIDIATLIFDERGIVVGARTLELRTLRHGEERAFRVSWRFPLPISIPDVKISAYTNLLDDQNFLRFEEGPIERFRELQ